MTRLSRSTALALVMTGLAACGDTTSPDRSSRIISPTAVFDQSNAGGANSQQVEGSGVFSLSGLNVVFAFQAAREGDRAAHGRFHQMVDEGGGLVVDFDADVTCLAIDAVNHRAWIGGVVTANRSTDPSFTTAINQPGRDIWFRVLDSGNGPDANDRSTFLGFQGAAGFPTSASYCAGQPWPAGNARTWPVISGGIRVHP